MAQYLVLIYEDEAGWAAGGPAAEAGSQAHRDFGTAHAVRDATRREWAGVLAATVRITRDLDLAEECVQDAYARALSAWPDGIPANPAAWLTTTARHRALDVVRRSATLRAKLPLLVEPVEPVVPEEPSGFPDDRLRLVFTCCHPA